MNLPSELGEHSGNTYRNACWFWTRGTEGQSRLCPIPQDLGTLLTSELPQNSYRMAAIILKALR
jgi:hypothetical protein